MNAANKQVATTDNQEHIGPDTTGDNIHAKKVALYVDDGNFSGNWVRMTQPSGSGGTVADPVVVAGTDGSNPRPLIQDSITYIDTASSTTVYIGNAPASSATSESVWQIKRIDTSSGTTILFAGGVPTFTQVWDDRASLSYS